MNLHNKIAAVSSRDLDDCFEAERIVLARHAGQEIKESEEEESSLGEAATEGEKERRRRN
jgi:hypothetical protein